MVLQVGCIGVVVYLFLFYYFLRKCLFYFHRESTPYWRAFILGVASFSFVILFISLLYAPIFTGGLIPLVYFLLVGFIYKIDLIKNQIESQALENPS
jgi:hypothetical protein